MRGNIYCFVPETGSLAWRSVPEETDCEEGREQNYQERKELLAGTRCRKDLAGSEGVWRWERDLPKEGRNTAASPTC